MKLNVIELVKKCFPDTAKTTTRTVMATPDEIHHFANSVLEEAAKKCESQSDLEYATGKVDHNERAWCDHLAAAIRGMKA